MKKNARMPEPVESCRRNRGAGVPRPAPDQTGCTQDPVRPLTFEAVPTLQARRSELASAIRESLPDPPKP